MTLPSLYAIVDRETLDARDIRASEFVEGLRDAGVRLLQYRDKASGPQEILRVAWMIADIFAGTDTTLILNDRADLAALLGWGVHVGQGDLPVESVRQVVGKAVIGISTHNEDQVERASSSDADYIAIGPVFPTGSKQNAEPVVGIEGVRRARALTQKPLIAIGGIDSVSIGEVRRSGADSVAVIGALMTTGNDTIEVARDLVRCAALRQAE